MSKWQRIRRWFHHAFAVQDSGAAPDPQERELARRLARLVVERRLTAPASMLLETGRPLNFIGSQALVFLEPFATALFSPEEYRRFVQLLEKRQGLDLLAEALEDEERSRKDPGETHE